MILYYFIISKAFDTVNHFKLYSTLIKSGVPVWIIDVIINWYSKLSIAVRWKGCLSQWCCVRSGVRQGSSLSPSIFNVFVNIFITRLRLLGWVVILTVCLLVA